MWNSKKEASLQVAAGRGPMGHKVWYGAEMWLGQSCPTDFMTLRLSIIWFQTLHVFWKKIYPTLNKSFFFF